ncbi:MAG: DUF559 domain-containing protein [Caulobacterales bacterium]
MTRFDRTPSKTARARALRKSRSNAEALVWSLLRGGVTGFHFRRQHPIGPFVADFYCAKLKLVIEMDGDQHALQMQRDQRRTDYLERKNLRVVRFWNRQMFADIRGFEQTLLNLIRDRASELGVAPQFPQRPDPLHTSPFQGEGHPRGAEQKNDAPNAEGEVVGWPR